MWRSVCLLREEDDLSMAGPPAAARLFNTVAAHLAGHRLLPVWAVLWHQGRRSGKEDAVPPAVIPTDTTFVIALPWGRGTDWVRNVRAAGHCTIGWKGAGYDCSGPPSSTRRSPSRAEGVSPAAACSGVPTLTVSSASTAALSPDALASGRGPSEVGFIVRSPGIHQSKHAATLTTQMDSALVHSMDVSRRPGTRLA